MGELFVRSHELFARSQKVSPGGVHSPVRAFQSVGTEPLFFSSAQGAHITTVEGDVFIDFCQSFGPNLLGHRDPDVAEAVNEMVQTAWSLGACEPYSLQLAEWMVQRLPWVDQLRFVCSGTEAVMSALRLARAATGRGKVLKFEGCYHGHTDSMLVKAGSGLAGVAASSSAGVMESVAEETLILPLDDEDQLEEVLQTHGQDLAAVILEPLPANYGLLKQRPEFIKKLCHDVKSCGALVIFDEVISGFRVGLGGMAAELDISPDLVIYGKVIGGGFPVGCFGGSTDLMKMVAPQGPVYQAGTLAAHPIGMRAGLATLKKAEEQGIYKILEDRARTFIENLKEGLAPTDWDVTSHGSLFWLHLKNSKNVKSVSKNTEFYRSPHQLPPETGPRFQKLFHRALKRGVYLCPSAFEVGFLSLAHTEQILKTAAGALIESAREDLD